MLFTSPAFLMLFLPLMLGVYALTPPKFRLYSICFFNIAFYALANFYHPASVVFLLLCAIFTYCASFAVFSVRRRSVLVFSLVVLLGSLIVLRYLGVQADETSARTYLPFGASFYLLASISCVIDTWRGDAKPPSSFFDVLAYVTFFPVLIVGPIIRYKDFLNLTRTENLKITASGVGSGIILFATGFIKRVAIASVIHETYDALVYRLVSHTTEKVGLNLALILITLLLVGAYYSFSGFSDMARGISAMLGIRLAPDFGSTIICPSPTYYASNFMRSLMVWVSDYVIDPIHGILLGNGKLKLSPRTCKAISATVGALAILMWFKMGLKVLPALLIVLLPALLDSVFDLTAKFSKNIKAQALGTLYTLPFITVFWILVRTRDISVVVDILSRLTLYTELQSYTMSLTLNNLEFPLIIVLMVLIQLPAIAGVLSRRKKSVFLRNEGLRWAYIALIMTVFVATIFYFLPQYPELATIPFHDIIF